MSRFHFAHAVACVCLGLAAVRPACAAESPDEPATRPRPKRVLFRTEAPAAPAPAKPVANKPTPTPVERRTAVVVPKTAPATPAPKTRAAVTVPSPVAPLPKPVLPQRTLLSTRFAEPARTTRSFDIEFQPTSFTPYDRYLGTVKSVIARVDDRKASMVTACELVSECRRFRYVITDLYRADPPAVTQARQAGDCKAKALWVYDHLGDPSAYYVIGKLVQRSRTSHAWVYWRNNGRWWILDPTVRSTPIAADSVSAGRYVPYYSFSRAGSFRHNATRIMIAANGIPAVGAKAGSRSPAGRSSAGEGARR